MKEKYLDKSKPIRRDWENLKVGDTVFDESKRGFASGGFRYGIGEKVKRITKNRIYTTGECGIYDRKTRDLIEMPNYYLIAFQSKGD